MRKVLFIFGQLSDSDVIWLGEAGRVIRVKTGESIIQSGTHVKDIYIVLDGELVVLGSSGVTLATLAAGEILGEMSFVDSRPTSATVQATKNSQLLAIAGNVVQQRISCDDAFASRFYRAIALFLASRMRATMTRLGYGSRGVDDEGSDEDDLDASVLESVHLAGGRFERLQHQIQTRR